MYLGMTIMLVSLAIILGTLPFYMSALFYFLVINTVFCLYEETKLQYAFGEEFLVYQANVRRWI